MSERRNPLVGVVDAETTGPDMVNDRIVEVAAQLLEVDWDSGQVLHRLRAYDGLQDPGIPISPAATQIHGLTDADVRGKAIDAAVLADVLGPADLVVAHFKDFDRAFVCQVLPSADRLPWVCSSRGIPWKDIYPSITTRGLRALADTFHVQARRAHRAMGDVETLIGLLNTPGLLGKRTFLHYLLHDNLQIGEHLTAKVSDPDPEMVEVVLGLRPAAEPPAIPNLWTPSGLFSRLLGA